ncbi:MAG: isochorismate synthase [Prevotella sp.]|nr:isochorismate synthase [Prevotella sp.]
MPGFAVYRLPYESHVTLVLQTDGEPMELSSCTELNGKKGFVVAPFEVRPDQPILLIPLDKVETIPVEEIAALPLPETITHPIGIVGGQRMHYAIDFANDHSQLELGTFRKIVLARCSDEETQEALSPLKLFHRACMLYPRMFISLVCTTKSGCWLTATPEILLEGDDKNQWRTIALAGTMQLEGEQLNGEGEDLSWSTKNIQEQRYVATYIAECLEQFTRDFHEEGPYTVRAANLVHLRSDFTFSLAESSHIGDLLQTLHPTPAVCGLPKREAFQFIVRNEYTPRRYYSGFMGMLDPERQTHLYVSLRCMNIEGRRYHLYAGGGLLKDSTEEQEWQEIEAKLETMRRCIAIKNM